MCDGSSLAKKTSKRFENPRFKRYLYKVAGRLNFKRIIKMAYKEYLNLIDESGKAIVPDGVTEIGGWAFEGCSGLTDVVIPNSITEIGEHAFAYCI